MHSFDVDVNFEEAILTASTAISTHALTKSGLMPGDSVLFIGLDCVSLTGIALARGMGASLVFVVGPEDNEGALKMLSEACGAHSYYAWDSETLEEDHLARFSRSLKILTGERGVDVVMISGEHQLPMSDIIFSMECVRKGGTVAVSNPWMGQLHSTPRYRYATAPEDASTVQSSLMDKELRYLYLEGFPSGTFEKSLRWIEGGIVYAVMESMPCTPCMPGTPLSRFAAMHAQYKKNPHRCALLYPWQEEEAKSEEGASVAKRQRTAA